MGLLCNGNLELCCLLILNVSWLNHFSWGQEEADDSAFRVNAVDSAIND